MFDLNGYGVSWVWVYNLWVSRVKEDKEFIYMGVSGCKGFGNEGFEVRAAMFFNVSAS